MSHTTENETNPFARRVTERLGEEETTREIAALRTQIQTGKYRVDFDELAEKVVLDED